MLEKHEVKVFLVNQRCDVCKMGYMTATGAPIYSYLDPVYEHKCNNPNCKNTTTYGTIFPHPEYEYLDLEKKLL